MKTFISCILFSFCFGYYMISSGQSLILPDSVSDSTATMKLDSLNQKLSFFTNQIRESEELRKNDSIRRVELLRELELVKASDYLRRKELKEKILALETLDSIRLIDKRKRVNEILSAGVGFPVAPFEDTLFFIYTKIGPFTPKERVESINKKIIQLVKDRLFYPDSLIIIGYENTQDIVYIDRIIMSISDMDAMINKTDQVSLAKQYQHIISQEIQNDIKARSLSSILIHIGFVVLIIGVVALLIFLTNRLFRYTKKYISTHEAKFDRSFRLKNYELISKATLLKALLWLNTVLKFLIFILIIYLALPSLFSVFPVTKSWANILIGWFIFPIKSIFFAFIEYLPNLIMIIVIIIVTRYLVKLLKFLTKEVQSGKLNLPGFHPDWAMPTFGILRFILYAFMFIIIFPYLPGSDSDIFKGVSVFLGVLISFGSSSAISNVVAGLVITYMRPFKIGDRIKLGDITGDVIEKTPLVIRVRTIKNEEITIPNSQILTNHTINYSNSAESIGLILHTTVTIGYDVPWQQVHALLIAAAKETSDISFDKEPFVLQKSLDDFSVAYEINAYTFKPKAIVQIYSELHQHIMDQFCTAGVEIMSPNYQAVRDGNKPAIPPPPKHHAP